MSGELKELGQYVEPTELVDLFVPADGEITQIYGRIGQGKTYMATSMVLNDLMHGEVVYTNWHLNYLGYDQRSSFFWVILGLFWPFKRRYYAFPVENLHYIEVDGNFLNSFEKLTDCKVYLDEGHIAFDSYEMAKMSLQKRKAVYHTRHFNRSIIIISQRTTSVHVSMRANVNRFYKCENLLKWPVLLFRRTEFQDMQGENVNEDEPVSVKWIWGSTQVSNAYDTKYLRGDMKSSQEVKFDAYDMGIWDKLRSLYRLLRPPRRTQ